MNKTQIAEVASSLGLSPEKIDINIDFTYIYLTSGKVHTQVVLRSSQVNKKTVEVALKKYKLRNG